MIKVLYSNKKDFKNKFKKLLLERREPDKKTYNIVNKIIKDVKKRGDQALVHYEKKFQNNSIIVPSKKDINKAIKILDRETKDALRQTYKRVHKWHALQVKKDIYQKDELGNKFYYKNVAINNVGIYCPNLPSSAIMNCVLAQLAGCRRIILCSPRTDGKLNGAVLYAAKLCGVTEFISLSGASAIAAMALGTKKIKACDKIFGPGSEITQTAKKILFLSNKIGVERFYGGPSEICCWVDSYSSPDEIASSLVSQAEHDAKSQSIMICKDKKLIEKVKKCIPKQLKDLPRKNIAKKSINKYGALIYANSDKKIIELINFIAPEHLEIPIKSYRKQLKHISNVGSIAAGPYSCMSLGDYGPQQHSLPTSGSAKYSGGLNVQEFTKQISINVISKKGLAKLSKVGYVFTKKIENLIGHYRSIKIKNKRRN